jgi:uncharacterized membrane protein YtjA (UPF0391 family)
MMPTLTSLPALALATASVAVPLQFGGLLWWAVVFFILALVAYVLGARGIAGLSMEIAQILALLFLVLAIIVFVLQFL